MLVDKGTYNRILLFRTIKYLLIYFSVGVGAGFTLGSIYFILDYLYNNSLGWFIFGLCLVLFSPLWLGVIYGAYVDAKESMKKDDIQARVTKKIKKDKYWYE